MSYEEAVIDRLPTLGAIEEARMESSALQVSFFEQIGAAYDLFPEQSILKPTDIQARYVEVKPTVAKNSDFLLTTGDPVLPTIPLVLIPGKNVDPTITKGLNIGQFTYPWEKTGLSIEIHGRRTFFQMMIADKTPLSCTLEAEYPFPSIVMSNTAELVNHPGEPQINALGLILRKSPYTSKDIDIFPFQAVIPIAHVGGFGPGGWLWTPETLASRQEEIQQELRDQEERRRMYEPIPLHESDSEISASRLENNPRDFYDHLVGQFNTDFDTLDKMGLALTPTRHAHWGDQQQIHAVITRYANTENRYPFAIDIAINALSKKGLEAGEFRLAEDPQDATDVTIYISLLRSRARYSWEFGRDSIYMRKMHDSDTNDQKEIKDIGQQKFWARVLGAMVTEEASPPPVQPAPNYHHRENPRFSNRMR